MQTFTFINSETEDLKFVRAANYGEALLLLGQEVIEIEDWMLESETINENNFDASKD